MKTPFLGGMTLSTSKNLAYNRAVNLYPEVLDNKDGKEIAGFYRCPGLTKFATVGTGPIRGAYRASNGTVYVVSGSELYSVGKDATLTDLGTVDSLATPVKMVDNGSQLLIVTGTGAWCLVFTGNVFSQVLPGSLGVSPQVLAYQDGFALVNDLGTNQFWQSNLNDFTTWDALDFSSADSTPFDVVASYDLHRECWLFKEDRTEVWINAGTSTFAFQRLQGVQIPVGCAAPYSTAHLSDGIVWLGADEQGDGVVYISDGYRARRISTHGLEEVFRTFSTIADAIGFSYQEAGHYFYFLTFPSGGRTFCFDMSTKLWHERASFANGAFGRHWANCHVFAFGKHLVGDYRNGNLYELDNDAYTDDGTIQKWLRSWRAMMPGKVVYQPVRFNTLQIDAQTGLNIPNDTTPQMMLRWSDDGGHNWSNEMWADSNKIGQTGTRVIFRRLGSTKPSTGLDRIFELSGTDPIPMTLLNAELDAEPA